MVTVKWFSDGQIEGGTMFIYNFIATIFRDKIFRSIVFVLNMFCMQKQEPKENEELQQDLQEICFPEENISYENEIERDKKNYNNKDIMIFELKRYSELENFKESLRKIGKQVFFGESLGRVCANDYSLDVGEIVAYKMFGEKNFIYAKICKFRDIEIEPKKKLRFYDLITDDDYGEEIIIESAWPTDVRKILK